MTTRSKIETFLDEHDFSRSYQRIDLGHGLHTPGTDRSNSLWRAIKGINLEGKTYLDIGCMWGAMVFKAETHGAKAYGCDFRQKFVDIAKGIAELKDSDAFFFRGDVLECDDLGAIGVTPPCFDVVSMFNVIHHLRHPFLALSNALSHAGECFIIEFPTLKGRWRKISVNSDSQTDTQAMGGPYLGIISKETGLYFTRWSMETAVNWFGDWKLEICERSPYRSDRLLMTFKRA